MNDLCAKVVTLKEKRSSLQRPWPWPSAVTSHSTMMNVTWPRCDQSTEHVVVGHVTMYICRMTVSATLHTRIASRKGRRPVFAQRQFSLKYSQSAGAWIAQFYMQITPCLPFPCKRSPDGAANNWGSRHPTAAYYSLIDRKGMIGWVGLVGWPIA